MIKIVRLREIVGPNLNKIQTGLEDVPTIQVTISSLGNLHWLTCFQSSRRSEKISRNRASSSTNCHGNDTHHVAVHKSYQTATLEHKLTVASLDKFKNIFSPWICELSNNDT